MVAQDFKLKLPLVIYRILDKHRVWVDQVSVYSTKDLGGIDLYLAHQSRKLASIDFYVR